MNVTCSGDEVKVILTPPFAESVTEGDIKWNKGRSTVPCLLSASIHRLLCHCEFLKSFESITELQIGYRDRS